MLHEMRESIAGGESAKQLLGFASLYRAIAESGLRHEREAAWDYRVAQAILPELARADFRPYGAAGAILESERAKGDELISMENNPLDSPDTAPVMVPPAKLRGDQPEYPFAKNLACSEEPVVVRAIIGADGVVSKPSMVGNGDPVLFLASTEALRTWQFRPAELNGRPVQTTYTLTVNFKLLYCRGPEIVLPPKSEN